MRKNISLIFFIILCFLNLTGFSIKDNNKEITLIEAYEKLEQKAKEWNSDAKLNHMISVDHPSIVNAGDDGKRITWSGIFHSVSHKESIVLSIKNGEIRTLTTASEEIPEDQLIEKESILSILFNSDEALEVAKKKYGLQLGTQWAKGYNYTLYRYSPDKKNILCVYGEDLNGYFTKVSFNFDTKQCLFAERKVPYGGSIWNSKKLLIENVWVMGADFSPNYIKDNKMAIYCIENPLTPKSVFKLKISTDCGATWVDRLFDEGIIKIKFSDNYIFDKTLFIITPNNIYKLVEENLYCIKSFPGMIIADINKDDILILSNEMLSLQKDVNKSIFEIIDNKKLYFSKDKGEDFSRINIPSDILNVKIGPDNSIYACEAKELLQYKNDKWTNINQPLSSFYDYDVTYDKVIGIGYMEDKVAVYDILDSKWTMLTSPTIIEGICSYNNNVLFIGTNGIYAFNEEKNSLYKCNIDLPIPLNEIAYVFNINNEYYFISKYGSSWEII